MPGQEVLYQDRDVVLYRSIRGNGVVELEKFVGLSPWDCKRSMIIRVNEITGEIKVRQVNWTCNAGAYDIDVVYDPGLARNFATTIKNMKHGYEGLKAFSQMLDEIESAAENTLDDDP